MFKLKHIIFVFVALGLALSLSGCHMAVLDPKGIIAADEKKLLLTAVFLMLLIVIPVIILTLFVARRYRASNTEATYSPNWSHSTILEIIWWAIPCAIIVVLATLTWISSHKLDPYRPLDSEEQPLVIQVVALDWRWLFIYPEQHIATVNFVEFPANKPIRFLITADAPMNSFAIPQLAGQIYAMAGMQTKLNLMASEEGDFRGLSTNYSGEGFSNMKFIARATSQGAFDEWVEQAKESPEKLTQEAYNQLAKPSENTEVLTFSAVEDDLFKSVIMKYMMPEHGKMQPMQMDERSAG